MRPLDPRLLRQVPETRRPLLVLATLGALTGAVSVAQAFGIAWLVAGVVRGDRLTPAAWLVLALLAMRGVLAAATEIAAGWASSTVAGAIRRTRLSSWLGRTVDERPPAADMVTLATQGPSSVETYVARYLPALVTAAVVPPLAIAALLVTDLWSAVIVVLTVPLLPLFAALIGQHTQEATRRRWAESTSLAGHFLDVVRGLPTLVGYGRARAQVGTVRAVGQRHRRASLRTLKIAFLSSAALELLATISVAMVAVGVGLRLASGSMGLQVGLTAILLAPEAYWPIRRVGQEFHAAADGAEALESLLPQGDSPAAVTTIGGPQADGAVVVAQNLSYRYPGAETDVIRHLSLHVRPGLTALVGPSGSGKTTLLELLAGLRRPSSGSLAAPTVHLVTQRPFVAPDTLGANLTLSDGGSAPLELPGSLRGIPSGAPLGDDGFGLSAGQRARLAIERARRSDAPLVLLDEPTAHLDPVAADEVRALVVQLATHRSVLVATHDPQLADLAGQHLRLDEHPASTAEADLVVPAVAPHRPLGSRVEQPVPPEAGPANRGRAASIRSSMVGGLAAACGVALTATSGWLIVQASLRPVILTLLTAIVCVRAFGVGRPVLRYAERVLSHDAALTELVEHRADTFSRLIPLTPARLGRRRRADLLTGFVRDLDDVVDARVRAHAPVIAAALTGALALVVGWWLYRPAGLVLAATLTLAAVVAAADWAAERRGQGASVAARGRVARAAQLAASNALELQAISATNYALEALDDAQVEAQQAAVRQARGRALGLGLSQLLTGVSTVVMALVTAQAITDGRLGAPTGALLLLTPLALGEVLGTLPDAMGALARSQQARRRVEKLLTQDPAVTDGASGSPAASAIPTLTLRGVSASWTGARTDLRSTDLALEPGTHLAITGPNGSGKSTLLAVLALHLDPCAGAYLVDGQDVHTLGLDAVRELFAIVDDETHVFAGTVRANLLLARPGSTDADVVRALVDAGLSPWFSGLPHGLDTPLGHDGQGMSGGERARLGVARALLSGRPVLLLDEPVAHLDGPTARAVLADLHAATAGRTVVVVTHQADGERGCGTVLRWGAQDATPVRSTP